MVRKNLLVVVVLMDDALAAEVLLASVKSNGFAHCHVSIPEQTPLATGRNNCVSSHKLILSALTFLMIAMNLHL